MSFTSFPTPTLYSDAGDALLEVQELSASHAGTGIGQPPVFNDISFKVGQGEVVCLLGASGCGKSTLLRTLGGLQPAQKGAIFLEGKKVREARPEIGFVFQKAVLFPWQNVRKSIAFGLTLRKGPHYKHADLRRKVDAALEDVDLHDAGHLHAHQLSGGMAQRVSLARALAREPSLLLLDEPLGALDAITRLEMQKLILDVAARHRIAVVWVTHDIDEALLVADRIFLMDRRPGRIVGEWRVSSPKPRFDSLDSLLSLRMTILSALSKVAGALRASDAAHQPTALPTAA